ncbi:MAG: nucleotidyltransferase family protein [Gemmatimonadota bacterium]|nr:nucleotidyltransferase family protein [Gemmatimonadota bacterium]
MRDRVAPAALSPELRVLLLSAGGAENDAEIARLTGNGLDWTTMAFLAQNENVASALWRKLNAACPPDRLSAAVELCTLARLGEFRQLQLRLALARVLDVLDAAGIDAVLLKGASLAVSCYPSFMDRPMSDLDVLVDASRVDAARSALLATGFVRRFGDSADSVYALHHHAEPLTDPRKTQVTVELHAELFPPGNPFRLTADVIRARARDAVFEGRRVRVPAVHDQLLHVCLHFGWSDAMSRGSWRALRDVREIVSTGEVLWPEFIALALENRAASSCYWTLRLARRLAGAQVPTAALDAFRPPHSPFVLDRLERHLVLQLIRNDRSCPSPALTRRLWEWAILPEWSGHGRARPWNGQEEFLRLEAEAPRTDSVWTKIGRYARRNGGWARYIRSVAS